MLFTRTFGINNPNFSIKEPGRNLQFIKASERKVQELLAVQKHVTLNELYAFMDIPPTRSGERHGWFREKNSKHIVFDVTQLSSGEFFLEFDTDGDISAKLPAKEEVH